MQQAMKNFPVTVYVVNECGESCKSAVAYLSRRGIPFTQKDGHQDAEGLKALTGGSMVVPVATVGATVLRGYEEGTWKGTLDAAGYPSAPVAPSAGGSWQARHVRRPGSHRLPPARPRQPTDR